MSVKVRGRGRSGSMEGLQAFVSSQMHACVQNESRVVDQISSCKMCAEGLAFYNAPKVKNETEIWERSMSL